MSMPAARIGDTTVHGGAIVVGEPSVLVQGIPAARMGDHHACPMVTPGTPPVPHVGGPILGGSPTVLINGRPAARVGDMALCVGPPDSIALGCTSCVIGDTGSSAGPGGPSLAMAAISLVLATQHGPPPPDSPPERHWVQYDFKDAAGRPVGGIPFRYTNSDGAVSRGRLPESGVLLRRNIPPGTTEVWFRQIVEVEWSKPQAMADETVLMKVTAEGFEGGETVLLTVMERDVDRLDMPVAHVETTLAGGAAEAQWRFPEPDPRDLEAAPGGSLRFSDPAFYFLVDIEGATGRSGLLKFRDWVEIELKDETGQPVAGADYQVLLRTGEVRTGQLDGSGRAREDDTPAGPVWISFPGAGETVLYETHTLRPEAPPAAASFEDTPVSPATPIAGRTGPAPKKAAQPGKLTGIQLTCQHGKRASLDGEIQVVPARTGDEVTLTAESTGRLREEVQWTVTGGHATRLKGKDVRFRVPAVPGAGAWLAGAKGVGFDVEACCEDTTLNGRIVAYPSDKLSITLTSARLPSAKEKLDYVLNKVLAQYVKDVRFKYLEGKGSIEGRWTEHTDATAFYKYEAVLKFAPLIGVSGRFPFGPLAAIPNWFKEYGDAYMYVQLSGGVDVEGSWGRATPAKHEADVKAKGYVAGAIGASLFLFDKRAVNVDVNGSTALKFEGRGEADEEVGPMIVAELAWDGIRGHMTVEMAWGVVEFEREFNVVDGGRLHDEPFRWPLVDESGP